MSTDGPTTHRRLPLGFLGQRPRRILLRSYHLATLPLLSPTSLLLPSARITTRNVNGATPLNTAATFEAPSRIEWMPRRGNIERRRRNPYDSDVAVLEDVENLSTAYQRRGWQVSGEEGGGVEALPMRRPRYHHLVEDGRSRPVLSTIMRSKKKTMMNTTSTYPANRGIPPGARLHHALENRVHQVEGTIPMTKKTILGVTVSPRQRGWTPGGQQLHACPNHNGGGEIPTPAITKKTTSTPPPGSIIPAPHPPLQGPQQTKPAVPTDDEKMMMMTGGAAAARTGNEPPP